jgi:ribose-phosphate pyrophosphokinase
VSQHEPLIIFSGKASVGLAREICDYLDYRLAASTTETFSDSELFCKINENVRGADCFIVQSTYNPGSEHLMELLLMIDALRRASAHNINAVVPYFGYSRQDRKDQGRVPLSAKLVANLIVTAGASRVITIDMHSGQIQGFFDIPVDHLYAAKITCDFVKESCPTDNGVVVSPDVGNVKRARAFAMHLDMPLAIIDKRRPEANRSEVVNVVGEVEGKDCFLFDDIIDTAGTICNAAQALKEKGAKDIYAGCTHPVLSGPARKLLADSAIKALFVTNTIPQENCQVLDKLQTISIAPLLGEAIRRIHLNQSVSALFQ